MADADGKNADNKKSKRKKTRNADGKKKLINKQTKQLRKEIFLSSRCHMVGPLHTDRDANSWHSFGVLLNRVTQ